MYLVQWAINDNILRHKNLPYTYSMFDYFTKKDLNSYPIYFSKSITVVTFKLQHYLLALLISKLWLGQDEMSFKDYLIIEGEDNIKVEDCMSNLVNMTLGQKQSHLGLTLMQSPRIFLGVDERPQPVI